MAIEKVPFNLSEVVKDFGSSSIKECGNEAGLKTPFFCTEFIGKGGEVVVKFSGQQHNFDFNTFYDKCNEALGGSWSGKQLHIIFESGSQYVSKASNVPCIKLDRNFSQLAGCILENNGHILGRGGNGGETHNNNKPNEEKHGKAGGTAIMLSDSVKLSINNKGIIGGGGGGGGIGSSMNMVLFAGDGGAPFGVGGTGWRASVASPKYPINGKNATYNTVNTADDTDIRGKGGLYGKAGTKGDMANKEGKVKFSDGGAAGKAINVSGGSVTWITKGDIRGEVS